LSEPVFDRATSHFVARAGGAAMVVRLVEIITKPNRTEEICTLFEQWALPLAKVQPAFCEGMCLLLSSEPRILVVYTLWESGADAEEYYQLAFPSIVRLLSPLVDRINFRSFDVGARVTSPRAKDSKSHPASPDAS
jgi:hypothetical protein